MKIEIPSVDNFFIYILKESSKKFSIVIEEVFKDNERKQILKMSMKELFSQPGTNLVSLTGAKSQTIVYGLNGENSFKVVSDKEFEELHNKEKPLFIFLLTIDVQFGDMYKLTFQLFNGTKIFLMAPVFGEE